MKKKRKTGKKIKKMLNKKKQFQILLIKMRKKERKYKINKKKKSNKSKNKNNSKKKMNLYRIIYLIILHW